MGGRGWRGSKDWRMGLDWRGRERRKEKRDEIRQRIGFGLFAPWPAALQTVDDMRLVDGTSAHLLRSNRLYSFIGFLAFLLALPPDSFHLSLSLALFNVQLIEQRYRRFGSPQTSENLQKSPTPATANLSGSSPKPRYIPPSSRLGAPARGQSVDSDAQSRESEIECRERKSNVAPVAP